MKSLAVAAAALVAALVTTPAAAADWPAVGAALGKTGSVQPGGVYRVGLPRSDLKVTLPRGDGDAPGTGYHSALRLRRASPMAARPTTTMAGTEGSGTDCTLKNAASETASVGSPLSQVPRTPLKVVV